MNIEKAIITLAMISAILELDGLTKYDKLKAIKMIMAIFERNM